MKRVSECRDGWAGSEKLVLARWLELEVVSNRRATCRTQKRGSGLLVGPRAGDGFRPGVNGLDKGGNEALPTTESRVSHDLKPPCPYLLL